MIYMLFFQYFIYSSENIYLDLKTELDEITRKISKERKKEEESREAQKMR